MHNNKPVQVRVSRILVDQGQQNLQYQIFKLKQ